MCGLRCTYCISSWQCTRQKVYKQTTNRLRVAVSEEQIKEFVLLTLLMPKVGMQDADFSTIISYVCFMLHDLYVCVFVMICMGVCESPWNGRPPPQRLHPWSTGCVLQAWPPGSHRSDCMEPQPSAGALGIHQPLGPQGGLEETHTQIYASVRSCLQTNL